MRRKSAGLGLCTRDVTKINCAACFGLLNEGRMINSDKFKGRTPGPWRWEFSATGKRLQLCGGARRFDDTVMDFVRVPAPHASHC